MKLAEDLRRSILQAAIQGKLTQQLDTDGTAEDLLKEIRAEKEQLIAEGKIKREKPLKPITDEKPFDIPKRWTWVRINDVFYKITDGTHLTPKYTSTGIPFLSVKDISGGKIDFSNTKYISESEHQELYKRCNPENGDLLITKVGTTGIPAIIDTDIQFSLFVSVALLKYFHRTSNARYLYLALRSTLVQEQARENTRGVGNKNWVLDSIKKTVFPLPPLAEQHRIVARVEAIISKIDELAQAEDELEAMKQKFPGDMRDSLLQAAIQGKLTQQLDTDGTAEDLLKEIRAEKERLIAEGKIKREKPLKPITDDEKPFDIPKNWAWERWGNFSFSIQYGYNAPALKNGSVKMVRISDIQNNKIQWSTVPYCEISDKEIQNYLLAKNDILFARTGGTVGKSYLVHDIPERVIYAGYLIRTRFSTQINPQYMKYFMESSLYWTQLRNGTTATAQPNCNGKTLSNMVIPFPPLAEQERIVKRLNELLQLCEAMKEKHDQQ